MKVMRSTKDGSVCADCGSGIKVGDPIAYFGPRAVFGLTCHENEKTKKHLARLLEEERNGGSEPRATRQSPEQVASQQEWVVRVSWEELPVVQVTDMMKWLLGMQYCGQLGGTLNVLEFRAPRNIGVLATKQWAENGARMLGSIWPVAKAEAAPRWE